MIHTYFERNNIHLFEWDQFSVDITTDNLDRLIFAYTKEGKDKTQTEAGAEVGLTKEEVDKIFRELKVTKESAPFSPITYVNSTNDQLVEKRVAMKRAHNQEKLQDAYIRELESKVGSDNFEEIVTNLVKTIKPIDPSLFPVRSTSKTNGCINFVFTDWHVGAAYPVYNKRFKGYNKDIYRNRIGQLLEFIQEHRFTEREVGTNPSIKVSFLGDMLNDLMCNMHKNQIFNQDATEMEQMDLCVQGIVQIITQLLITYKKPLHVYAVPGNHDRLTKNRDEDPNRFAHQLLWRIVQAELSAYAKSGAVRFHVKRDTNCFGYQVTDNIRVLINHGDSRAKAQDILSIDGMYDAGYKVILEGHRHIRKVQELNGGLLVTTPSLVGPSSYSDHELHSFSRPGQSVITLKETEGMPFVGVKWVDVY